MPIINIKHLFNLDRFYNGNNPDKLPATDLPEAGENNINRRIEKIYGRDEINLQLLFEKWVGRDDWKLKDEAIPLLMAMDPENKSLPGESDIRNIYDDLWLHAKGCVEQGLLKVINDEQPPEEWRAQPTDVYCWAKISRVEVPESLGRLMEFVITTLKNPEDEESRTNRLNHGDGVTNTYDINREKTLGMALAILAAFPEQCKNSKGKVTAEYILKIMDEKNHLFPDIGISNLSTESRTELLEKWLNTISSD